MKIIGAANLPSIVSHSQSGGNSTSSSEDSHCNSQPLSTPGKFSYNFMKHVIIVMQIHAGGTNSYSQSGGNSSEDGSRCHSQPLSAPDGQFLMKHVVPNLDMQAT